MANNQLARTVELIRAELVEQAYRRYPDNVRLQLIYQIGFLEAQLAQAINDDNKNYSRFKRAIEQAERWQKRL